MAQQPRLDVVARQRLAQQGVRLQVDLPHRQVVAGAPEGVDAGQFLVGQRPLRERTAEAVLRLLGGRAESAEVGEDVAALASGDEDAAAVFDHTERAMIRSVLHLAEQPIPTVMTPRLDIVWLDLEADAQRLRKTLQQHSYSRYLVCRGELDDLQGVVQRGDLFSQTLAGESLDLRKAMREPLVVGTGSVQLLTNQLNIINYKTTNPNSY